MTPLESNKTCVLLHIRFRKCALAVILAGVPTLVWETLMSGTRAICPYAPRTPYLQTFLLVAHSAIGCFKACLVVCISCHDDCFSCSLPTPTLTPCASRVAVRAPFLTDSLALFYVENSEAVNSL